LSEDRQRIDKWLWHARVVRTRTAAASLVSAGHVRVNGARVEAPGRPVRAGDMVTVALDRRVRVLKVLDFAPRRGSAELAGGLFEEQPIEQPAVEPATIGPVRDSGSGRPTKRDRRRLDGLTNGSES
jgi:ribosome-associated heat shock protein Hsp15